MPRKAARATKKATTVETLIHDKAKRKHIPTAELQTLMQNLGERYSELHQKKLEDKFHWICKM